MENADKSISEPLDFNFFFGGGGGVYPRTPLVYWSLATALPCYNKLLYSSCKEQSKCAIFLSYYIASLHESWSVDGLGVVILNGYLALLLGVHRCKSGCHWSMLFSENTLLSRSHCKCAVLYFTALFSPCFENPSKSVEDQMCAENTFWKMTFNYYS